MTQPSTEAADRSLSDLDRSWEHFFGAIRRAKVRAAREPTVGLSLAQYLLLRPLLDGEAVSVGDLAAGAGVTAPTASRMLDGLARDGLVVRQGSERDRRSVEVRLTEDGEQQAQAKRGELIVQRERFFSQLSEEERAQAAILLDRLAESIEALL